MKVIQHLKLGILLMLLIFLNILCTAQKKIVEPEDYDLWGTLSSEKISPTGEWISYKIEYEDDKDTLFLINDNKSTIYKFPSGRKGEFSPDGNWFVFFNKKRNLQIIDLVEGEKNKIEHVSNFEFSPAGAFIAVLKEKNEEDNQGKQMELRNFSTGFSKRIRNVAEINFNEDGSALAYTTADSTKTVKVHRIGSDKEDLRIKSGENFFHRLTWQPKGNALIFLEKVESTNENTDYHNILYYYSFGKRNPALKIFDPREQLSLKVGEILDVHHSPFLISEDGERVFFGLKPFNKKPDSITENVEIWYSTDKIIFPRRKLSSKWWIQYPKLSVWWPGTGKFLKVASNELSFTVITGNQEHVISYSPAETNLHFGEDYTDFYITNLHSGKRIKFLEDQLIEHFRWMTKVSPGGNYISYFRNKHWWVYNISENKHTQITKDFIHPFFNIRHDQPGTPHAYGSAGWTEGDEALLVYDRFDIWKISPDGERVKRLTKGREKGITFRIENPGTKSGSVTGLNMKENLFLKAFNEETKESGFFILTPKQGLEKIRYGNRHIYRLRKADKKRVVLFREEKFNLPPVLQMYEVREDSVKQLIKTNHHQENYFWGKSELISYENEYGVPLKGALYYPANYEPGKKYPMIVNIYERKSDELHHYQKPGFDMTNGFNVTNFTLEGYFVLQPDIAYQLNNPGISAFKNVVPAVKKVIATKPVDISKIGLMGHSFGGYQTSMVVSQSDIFSAAVSGSATSDLISRYLSISENNLLANGWRFELQQYRFLGPYYNHTEDYLRNSPVHNIQTICTPLLSWTGKIDNNVDWSQSIELYLAMRRAGKAHILLVYPKEKHHILKEINRKDLYSKILNWFDYFLKGEDPANWLKTWLEKNKRGVPETPLSQ